MSALRLAELVLEAGIPEGVVNVLVGKGSVVGARLVEHPDMAKIGFTGSTEVGRTVMARRRREVKRVTLELGGKSANVVFADADLERPPRLRPTPSSTMPARTAARARESSSTKPPTTVRRAWSRRPRRKVGDPEDDETEMGPLISAAHRETVSSFVEGEPLFRGEAPGRRGILVPVHARRGDERRPDRPRRGLGPVAAVIPFADEAEAIRLANDTPYGLSGSIWTRDGARALRVARAVEAGVLSVNSNSSVRVSTPFGGMKQSGFGRELGMHGARGLLGGQERVPVDGGLMGDSRARSV